MWTYRQATGLVLDAAGDVLAVGYSGQPPHTNVPADEGLEGLGPIPCGNWMMTELQAENPKLGPNVIVLAPDDATRARILAMPRDPDSFRIHGERIAPPIGYASDGCIVLEPAARREMWESPDPHVQVV